MTDVLERPRTPDEYRTLAMLADISDLHVDARKRLMSIMYEYRERERALRDEVSELRRRLATSETARPTARSAPAATSDGRLRTWIGRLGRPHRRAERADGPVIDLIDT